MYLITITHHVIEGLGWVFDFRIKSLITPITFGIPLLITLGLLYLYRQTRQKFFLVTFSLLSVLWWGFGIGLFDGFYNHTLNTLLWLVRAPQSLWQSIYPHYNAHPLTLTNIPCDAAKFCSVTPAVIIYELAGIASFIAACVLTIKLWQFVKAGWHETSSHTHPSLSPATTFLVGLGMVAGVGMTPALSRYMGKGKPQNLMMALVLMAICVGSVLVALYQLKAQRSRAAATKDLPRSKIL